MAVTHPAGLVGGRYRLAERIGAGAMGVVWRAHDERLNRTVALKQLVLPPMLSAEEQHQAAERIMREGRLAARLHHPNAIAVFDVADHAGSPWLVMEYLASRSLAAVLTDRGRLAPHEVASIGRQLADALTAAHAAGIVHRDVKPGNVLLGDGPGGRVVAKLTDFGISRGTDDVTVTRTGVLSGTPAFLAPEVARGTEPSTASDVFALGATLYAAVEGHTPFGQAENSLAMLHLVARGQVHPPRQAGPLTALLMHLMRNEPAERPTMAHASAALARIADGGGYQPPPPVGAPFGGPAHHTRVDLPPVGVSPGYAPGDGKEPGDTERRPALLVAVAVALVVLAGLFVLAASMGDDTTPSARPTSTTVPPTTPAPSTATTTTTTTTTTVRPATPAELQKAVQEYYALLPGNPERAWDKLSPSLQSTGYDEYEKMWDEVESVQAVPTNADAGSMTVRVFVLYRLDERRPRAETRELTLVRDGETLLIDSDRKLGEAQVPTTTRKRRG